jgi:trk system potassium uptake protein TrkA
VARVNSDLHERILRLVGADLIVNPERAFGERFANLIMYEGVMGELPLGSDLIITELKLPKSFVGRTLMELELPRRYRVTVVAVRRPDEPGSAMQPDPRAPLAGGDVLVVVSPPDAVSAMLERV